MHTKNLGIRNHGVSNIKWEGEDYGNICHRMQSLVRQEEQIQETNVQNGDNNE